MLQKWIERWKLKTYRAGFERLKRRYFRRRSMSFVNEEVRGTWARLVFFDIDELMKKAAKLGDPGRGLHDEMKNFIREQRGKEEEQRRSALMKSIDRRARIRAISPQTLHGKPGDWHLTREEREKKERMKRIERDSWKI